MYLIFSITNIIEMMKHIPVILIIVKCTTNIIIDINTIKMLMIVLKPVIQYGIVI